jgi:hypothetical protein
LGSKAQSAITLLASTSRTALKLFIKGRFLSQELTGFQRHAAELVKAIDGLVASDRLPAALRGAERQLLVHGETSGVINRKRGCEAHQIVSA